MRTPSIIIIWLSSSAAALAQGMPHAGPAGPIVQSAPPSRALVSWLPGEVRCDSGTVAGSPMRRPWGTLIWGTSAKLEPVTYRFEIDTSGRPLSIKKDGADIIPFPQDVGPALAASRFSAGTARQGCTVTYAPDLHPLDTAPVADLVSYTITPMSGPLPKEGWDRIKPAGTCTNAPRSQPLVRAFPNFREIASTPGVKDWSLVSYDTDGNGKTANIRIASGTGNSAMNAASMKAVRESRFSGGARTGCLYPYWRAPGKLVAPPAPEEASFRPANATCAGQRNWATEPVLRFPEPYRRRAIEGWAVISYDVAPWGETGNVKVLTAEPSEDFGKQAVQVIRSARMAPSQGMSGCVDRVRFVMGPEDMPPAQNDPPQPLY